jgi:hypothetical protein
MTRWFLTAAPLALLAATAFPADPDKSVRINDPVYQALTKKAAALKPTAAELRYLDMPWVVDLDEALKQARDEKRPLFFWAAGGRDRDGVPLERC